MPANPSPKPAFDPSVLESISDQLACPACLGDLRIEGDHLLCASCTRTYPIIDGIPVLIAGREEMAQD
jgi:uncharacterized protein